MTQSHPIAVTDASFMADVLESTTPVLVDFWAQWCGPAAPWHQCSNKSPPKTSRASPWPSSTLTLTPLTVQQYQVVSIPTLIVFNGGQPVARIVGARGKSALLSDLTDYL
jgi:thioredoxin 1